jgi:hypothetical protein
MRSIFLLSLLAALILASVFTPAVRSQAKKMASVSLSSLNQIYSGLPRSATATTSAPGIRSFKFTYNGSSAAPTAVGSYNVVCTLVHDKYQGSATGTLVIAKATATVSLGNLSHIYNGSPKAATATTSATGSSTLNVTYNGSAIAPTAAGNYNVVAKLANANYEGSTTGTLTIAKATATVSLGDLSQTYNGLPRSATAATNATGNRSFEFIYNGSSSAPIAPGNYSIVVKLANANYQGTATGTLVISKASSVTGLTFSPSKAIVGETMTLTATVNPTLNGVLPGGKVTFKDGDTVIETVTLANTKGMATATLSLKLAAGKHRFAAAYSGDTNFAASTSSVTPKAIETDKRDQN